MAIRETAPPVPPDIAVRGTGQMREIAPASMGGQRPAPPVAALQVFPPWLYPIRGAVDFYPYVSGVAVAAVANTRVTPAALQLALKQGYAGVLRFLTLFIDSPTTLCEVRFELKINGNVVPGWANLRSFPRNAQSISLTTEGFVKIPVAGKISVDIVNETAGGPWLVGASYGGWMWPIAAEPELYGRIISA